MRLNSGLLVILLLSMTPLGYAEVDEHCLVIEEAFAQNAVHDLVRVDVESELWESLRNFRLAAAYIPADQNKKAGDAIRQGLRAVQAGLNKNPENVELLLLGAMLDGQYLLLRPWRYFWNGRRGLKRLAKAESLDPDNPRIALVRGTAKFILPRLLGGSPKEAEMIFTTAINHHRLPGAKFGESQLCRGGEWGQVDLLNWLARAQSKLGKATLARETFARAANRSPNNHWVDLAVKGEGYEWTQN